MAAAESITLNDVTDKPLFEFLFIISYFQEQARQELIKSRS